MLLIQNAQVLDPYTGLDARLDLLIGDDGILSQMEPHIDAPAGCPVFDAAGQTGAIVTAEEHSVIGGLGSAVAETVCEANPVPVVRVGVEDKFGASGPAVEMLKIYGLCASNIVEKAKKAISMK